MDDVFRFLIHFHVAFRVVDRSFSLVVRAVLDCIPLRVGPCLSCIFVRCEGITMDFICGMVADHAGWVLRDTHTLQILAFIVGLVTSCAAITVSRSGVQLRILYVLALADIRFLGIHHTISFFQSFVLFVSLFTNCYISFKNQHRSYWFTWSSYWVPGFIESTSSVLSRQFDGICIYF